MKTSFSLRLNAHSGRTFTALMLLVFASLSASPIYAQVYRIVGPDGKISFSDQPPPVGGDSKAITGNVGSSSNRAAVTGLPFDLRRVATKFPVTLYSSESCIPCSSGRSMLTSRGIPFTEKTVNTSEDGEALKRLSGANSLPLLTIGSQHLKGFSDAEWTQFLDAAGYPSASVLPAAYQRSAPTPLVLANTAPLAAPSGALKPNVSTAAGIAETPVSTPPSPANPAGIRF